MDGFAKSEPALNGACCAGPDPYRPIGKFQLIGRIYSRTFSVTAQPDTACPAH